MPIFFSEHALRQSKRRSLLRKQIIETVYHFEQIEQSYRGRKLRRKMVGGRMLEVVAKTEGSRITVVTTYYLE